MTIRSTGAVRGVFLNTTEDRCVPGNATAWAAPTVDGIHNITCTFENVADVPFWPVGIAATTPAPGEPSGGCAGA